MSTIDKPTGYALIADVVGSTETRDFVQSRDGRLETLSRRHVDRGLVRTPYTITAWDEFQAFDFDPAVAAGVILELRQAFAPLELRIGVGLGSIEGWPSERPINEAVTGLAFERAREALESLETRGDKVARLTRFRTGSPETDALLDLIYGLHDTLVQGVTERQWETIGHALNGASQEEIASMLQVDPSTVSRNLRRGCYWQMQDTVNGVSELLTSP